MNTKNKQNQKNQRQSTRHRVPDTERKKQGRQSVVHHEQEHAETRMTR
jgi:hypothetical protein